MPAIIETRDEPPPLHRLAGSLRDVPIAPTLTVPETRIISVEHPCIVRNLDKALKSMGNEPRVKHILDHAVGDSLADPSKPRPEPEVGVSLRPDDPFAAKLTSIGVATRNLLLRVTLPKRTGRKRKRGSDQPFERCSEVIVAPTSITAPDLLARLRDNESAYVIQPVGMVKETHRFRNLPDFQLKAADVPIFQELNSHILDPKWENLKHFKLDESIGLPIMSSFPAPPSFAASGQPYRYEYQQAAAVRFKQDEHGNILSVNMQTAPKKLMARIPPDIDKIPDRPPPELLKHDITGTHLVTIIERLRILLEERPLVTTRVALNHIPHCGDTLYREATQYVGYSFKAGPFRDTLIKYGVDPRKDPELRIYQTLMFQLDKRASRVANDKTGRWNRSLRHIARPEDRERLSHVFDGQHVSMNGKTWQVCDITDPLLKRIFDTSNLPRECDALGFGWFHDGTMCKARVIMREKIDALVEGRKVEDDLYELVATMPDDLDEFPVDRTAAWFGTSMLAGRANALAGEVRNLSKGGLKGHLSRLKKAAAAEEQAALHAATEQDIPVDENGDDSGSGDESTSE